MDVVLLAALSATAVVGSLVAVWIVPILVVAAIASLDDVPAN